VVFIDGTGNNAFKQKECNSTNIRRLWKACEHAGNDEIEQRVYYKPGPGTRNGEELVGKAFGAYLQDRVNEALEFLENERTKPGNAGRDVRVYMYGFSRGAYAVRCLAALYKHPIEVLGVFDTVKATLENKIDVSAAPDDVKNVFHAMAIDEYRWDFNITRFEPRQNLQEVWFAGCHSDIGGYYVEGDLSYITLNWMVDLSVEQGLLVDRSLIPSVSGTYMVLPTIHNEKKNLGWRALDWVRGKANFKRTISALDFVHSTVGSFRQLGYNPDCLPSDIVVWNNRGPSESGILV